MNIRIIILLVITIVLLILVINYYTKDVTKLTGLVEGKTMTKIEATSLTSSGESSDTGSSNYSYSIWFYIDDWNYRYGEPKVLFGRMTPSVDGAGLDPCPSVVLGAVENNLAISLAVYPGLEEVPQNGNSYVVHNCGISNIPLQKWVNLLISVYGRSLDVYIDGKLVRTCLLPGVAKVNANSPVYVTPKGGFSGWTSKFQYFPNATDPQKAYNIYKEGYGASTLGFLGRYTIKVSVMEGDVEQKSITI